MTDRKRQMENDNASKHSPDVYSLKSRGAVSLRLGKPVMGGSQIQYDPPGVHAERRSEGRWKIEDRFVKLFDELWLSVYRYSVRACLCPDDAEDIAQEVFLRLFKHLLEQKREENLRSWAFRVAHNLAIDHSRDRRRLTLRSTEEWGELGEVEKDQAPSPEELLISKERLASVGRSLGSLSPLQRQCLRLRMEGLAYGEIGEVLGMRSAAVGQSLHRAIRKLRTTGVSEQAGR
jgi:RNA polymerase sigma-70 factor, ECF subfamily